MERCFIMILNNALTVSVLIFAIIVLRLLFQKAPKRLICFLWVIVGEHFQSDSKPYARISGYCIATGTNA